MFVYQTGRFVVVGALSEEHVQDWITACEPLLRECAE